MKWLIAAMMVLSTASAFAGNELGNGGDSFAQEFVAIGRTIVERLKAKPDPQISAELLSEAVENTSVITKDKLELRGVEVDAINYPVSNRVEVNRSRWKEYGAREKTSLVLHEYLGIAGVDDARYEVSGRYVEIQHPQTGTADSSIAEWKEQTDRNLSVAIGHGYSTTGSNLGKLYGGSSFPNYELRLGYALSRKFALSLNGGIAKFNFVAEPLGDVDVKLLNLGLALQYLFLGDSRFSRRTGISPYLFVSGDQVFRGQKFKNLDTLQRDNAFALSGGLGAGYFIVPGRASVWIEGKVSNIFFRDRYEQTYILSDIPDSTGMLYAANIGVQIYF